MSRATAVVHRAGRVRRLLLCFGIRHLLRFGRWGRRRLGRSGRTGAFRATERKKSQGCQEPRLAHGEEHRSSPSRQRGGLGRSYRASDAQKNEGHRFFRWPRLSSWSGRRDLNPRRPPWQGGTLPLSYSRGRDGETYIYRVRPCQPFFEVGVKFFCRPSRDVGDVQRHFLPERKPRGFHIGCRLHCQQRPCSLEISSVFRVAHDPSLASLRVVKAST